MNYKIEAINVLLNKECILERYYPLIPFKDEIVNLLKEIDKLDLSEEERKSFQELYLLPGVKETRARLYYLSGLRTLNDIANKTTKEIIKLSLKAINKMNLISKAPLEKEVNTHITVARLLTIYRIKINCVFVQRSKNASTYQMR